MGVDILPLHAGGGYEIPLSLPRSQGFSRQVIYLFRQYIPVIPALQIPFQAVRQPQQIVGDPGADPPVPLPIHLVPPMLYVPLLELMGTAAQDLLSGPTGIKEQKSQNVLQLIPKAVSAAVLIGGSSPQETAGCGLIESPAVQVVV